MNVLLLSLLAATSLSPITGTVPEADKGLAFKFKSPLVNGLGTASLAALRGRPVLVEFWGTY